MAKLQRLPLARQAAEVILSRTTSGEWPPGHRLPGEAALAAELGVGRSTVREAIRELAGQGVLQTRQGAGVFVIAAEPVEDWETVLRRAEIVDILEGRIAVETESAHRAAERRTPHDLEAMRDVLARRAHAASDAPDVDYVDIDLEFHRIVVAAAHNPVLAELFDSFRPRVRQAMIDMVGLSGPAARSRHDHDVHTDIVDAIRDRDPERAAAVSRAHLVGIHRRMSPGTPR
ncbi:FadR/GntR family transcriptional regulator [Pseudonocardia sichuanensis]